MKLLISRQLPDSVLAAAEKIADVELRGKQTPMTLAEARASLHVFDAILPTLGDDFSAEAFTGPSRCKLLANFGVGYNHIDVAAAKVAGVAVTNTPGAVTEATADIALTLMLMSCRRAGEGERLVRSGQWTGWHPIQMLGMHMSGKTLGIVGMGRIGQAIARRAKHGFAMQVQFFNRSPKSVPGCHQVAELQELLANSDIVVVAVPGGNETRHLINAKALSWMKRSAVLVNIARGDVIDEAALIAALQSGKLASAGLDVYENEPSVPEALKILENVTLLPHLGTAALEVREAMGMMAVENLAALAAGRPLPNPD